MRLACETQKQRDPDDDDEDDDDCSNSDVHAAAKAIAGLTNHPRHTGVQPGFP
jgi:hypothetical protein